jgi:hypothetical protein
LSKDDQFFLYHSYLRFPRLKLWMLELVVVVARLFTEAEKEKHSELDVLLHL